MIIIKKNIEILNELYLHDMELHDIKIDYSNHKVIILIYDEHKNKHIILFENMQNFSINIFEPWGEGIYISEVKAITSFVENQLILDKNCNIDTDAFITEILLNSGDKIKILAKKIQFI